MSPPGLRAAWGHPRRSRGDGCHPAILTRLARLQLLTRTGCRDLSGFRAELGHTDLSRSKDAPVHNTHVKRAGGALSPCPSALGCQSDPRHSPPCSPPTLDLLTSHFLKEDTTSAPHLALGPASLGVPQFPGAMARPQPAGSPPALALPERRSREERGLQARCVGMEETNGGT